MYPSGDSGNIQLCLPDPGFPVGKRQSVHAGRVDMVLKRHADGGKRVCIQQGFWIGTAASSKVCQIKAGAVSASTCFSTDQCSIVSPSFACPLLMVSIEP